MEESQDVYRVHCNGLKEGKGNVNASIHKANWVRGLKYVQGGVTAGCKRRSTKKTSGWSKRHLNSP